jgi:hypothetical protein
MYYIMFFQNVQYVKHLEMNFELVVCLHCRRGSSSNLTLFFYQDLLPSISDPIDRMDLSFLLDRSSRD